MSFNNGPRTVTTGLSLLVDAADPLSYPGSGTSWTDIVTGITGSLSGSITYASDFKGALVVNNSSSVIIFPTSSANFGINSFTVELAFQPNQINGQHWLVAKNSGSFPSWGAFITGSSGSGRITAFFNISSTVSCSMSTPTGSIVTGSNYLVDINFLPNTALNSIYLNSELSANTIPNGTGSLTATSSLFISNRNSGSSVGIPLEIFNTKLYTPKLVPGRIRQNYNSLSTRLNLPQKSFVPIIEDLILDLVPGAAAAYSLRLLTTTYSGSAVRVRRSSDNAEQDINFTGVALDTTNLLSFVGTGSGFVTTWYDQSGNNINATQSISLNQPLIVSSGSLVTENSKSAINFNNQSTVCLNLTNTISAGSFTVLWVSRKNALSTNQSIILNGPGDSYMGENVDGNGVPFVYVGARVISTLTNNNSLSGGETSLHLSYVNRRNSTQAVGQINNSNNSYNNSIPSTTITITSIANYGLGYNYVGRIQEMIIYTTDQSPSRTSLSTDINTYYQIY